MRKFDVCSAKETDAKIDINNLFVGTAGTQCLATSATFPFKTRTDLKNAQKPIIKPELYTSSHWHWKFVKKLLTPQEAVLSMNLRIHQDLLV